MQKKHISRIIPLLLILAIALAFVSCNNGDKNDENSEKPDTVSTIDGEYKIIFEGESARTREVAKELQHAIYKKSGIMLALRKDSKEPEGAKEILVGNTSRTDNTQDTEDIGSGGWKVYTNDEKIIIKGATSEALAEAVEHFASGISIAEDGTARFSHANSKTEYKTNTLAEAGITLRVATFNIQNGSGVNHDMSKLAELITPLNLDIVGLQEVDVGTSRAGGLDTLKLLAEAAGYQYYEFSAAIDYRGGKYGHAIMSKYPITSYETENLFTPDGYEKRVYSHAVLNINGENIDFYNTHLSFEDKNTRLAQFTEMSAAIANKRGFILTADFNTESIKERQLIAGGVLTNNGLYTTFPSNNTGIDDIILHKGWDVLDSGMLDVGNKSDHNLLWAEIRFVG